MAWMVLKSSCPSSQTGARSDCAQSPVTRRHVRPQQGGVRDERAERLQAASGGRQCHCADVADARCGQCRRSGTPARGECAGSHLQVAAELRQRRHAHPCRQGCQQLAALRQGLPGLALLPARPGDARQREEDGAQVEPVLRCQRRTGEPDHGGQWPHLRDRQPEQGVLGRWRNRPHDLEVRALAARRSRSAPLLRGGEPRRRGVQGHGLHGHAGHPHRRAEQHHRPRRVGKEDG